MTEVKCQQNEKEPHSAGRYDEINLLDLLLVLVRHKKLILGACAATFLLTCGMTLLMPNIYTATARILPPQQENNGFPSTLGNTGRLAALAGVSVGSGSGELYVGLLQSRTVADAVIDRFDLMEVYQQKYRSRTYDLLKNHVTVSLGKKDGIITISFDDKDPRRAAAIANAFVEEIKKLNVALNLSSAGRERAFLDERLKVVRQDLLHAEENLKKFQEENKAIRIDDQASAIIEAISRLKGELASKEVEVGVLLTYQTEQNPQVKALREAIEQLKGQLRRLEQSPAGQKAGGDSFIPTSEVPALGVQYARLLREFKVQETLYELLTKQSEAAKIGEAKNTSTIQVIDVAVAPDRKSKPKRSVIVLLITCVAFISSAGLAFVREYSKRMPMEDRRRWEEIKGALRP